MKKTLFLSSILFTFLFFSSCTSSDDGDLPQAIQGEKLIGTWEIESFEATPGIANAIAILGGSEQINYEVSIRDTEDYSITFEDTGFVASRGYYNQDTVFTFNEESQTVTDILGGGTLRNWQVEDLTLTISSPFAFTVNYLVDEVTDTQLRLRREVSAFVKQSEVSASINILIDEIDVNVPLIITGVSYVETLVFRRVN